MGEVVTRYPYGNVGMDHLLSKEPKRGICLVLSVLRNTQEIIENWIIKKTFLRKRKRQDEENEIREKEIKVDSSGRKVKKLRKREKEKF